MLRATKSPPFRNNMLQINAMSKINKISLQVLAPSLTRTRTLYSHTPAREHEPNYTYALSRTPTYAQTRINTPTQTHTIAHNIIHKN